MYLLLIALDVSLTERLIDAVSSSSYADVTWYVRDIYFYSACKELKPSFYVNDSLTPTRSKIAFTIRQLKNKFPDKIKGCRSYNGEPRASIVNEGENVRRTRNSTMSTRPKTSQIVITTKEELDNFVRDHLKTSLVDLSMQW